MKRLRTAVIGMGNMGTAHAASVARGEIEGLCLTAVCDIVKSRALSFAEKYPNITAYSDYDTLLSDGNTDCVIIAVPHPLHSEMAIKALENGIHAMVEKPVDISVSKAIELNSVAEKSGCVFGIMLNQRTNPLFIKTREIVKSGALGELKRSVWIVTNWFRTQSYYDSGDWRATWDTEGGGVLINQAPHNLDIWQWICGMPERVTAFCDIGKHHNIEVEDDVTIFARYKNGAVGTFITSTGEYPGTNRLEITGDRGKLVLENGTLKWWKLKESVAKTCHTDSRSFASIDYDYTEITAEQEESGHTGVLKNFADAVLFGEELIAPGYEGVNELMISNAAYLSSRKGNKEIALPFNYEEFDKMLAQLAKSSQKRIAESTEEFTHKYKERWQVNW